MKLHCRIAILVFIFSSFVVKSTISQNYVEIGTGVIENTMPIYSSWNYSWSDLVYNHTDLGAAKTITKIGLNCTNGPKTVTNQKMYVKLSSNTIYATAGFEDPISNGYTLVYDGSLTFVNGWNEIILTSPIVYDGVQNILIHWENRWGNSYGPKFLSSASTINNNKNCGNDATFPLPGQNGYLNPYPSSLTNMRFYYTSSGPATPTNPVPADNATVVSVDTDLSWTLGANTTNYDLYFGTDPLNLPLVVNNAAAIAGINTYTVPGLLSDSAMHYWRVIAKNGSQQEPSPIWKFKTEVVIDQFPYYEGFEDSLVFHTYPVTSAWVISPDVSWYEYNVNPHSGLLCAKSSFYNSSNSAVIRSPKVILPAGYSISYFWRNTSANKVAAHDTTYAEVSVNGGITWLKIDTLAPLTQNASYIQRTHNLNSYAGNNFYFRFRHTTDNSGSACNVYLDDISIFQNGAAATLAVTPSNQDVSSAAGSALFAVTSNSAWTVTSDQSWCTVTPSGSGNGNITASYTENASGVQRLAHITISVSGLSPVVVTLTQGISVATLSVTPPNQSVTAPAGSTNFAVSSGTSWTAVSNQTWCTVTPSGSGNGTLTATYAENSGFASRIANITVSASGSSPVLVTVTQEAALPYLAVTPGNQDAGSPAGTTNFSVSSNLSWTALSDAGWCVVTAAGTGTSILFATYAENTLAATRVAHITVSANGLSPVTVTLTQLGTDAVLSILPLIQNVSYQAGMATFAVTSNVTWATVSDASWCQTTSGGTGSGVINAVYGQNETMVTRIAHITVSAAGVTPVNIQVIQQPSYVSISEPDASVLQVFPNPAHYQMHVKFPGAKPGDRYSVENMAGEKILEHSITDPEFIIELSGFPKAAYVLKIMSGNKAIIRKILVD